jgi:hypothetical protein
VQERVLVHKEGDVGAAHIADGPRVHVIIVDLDQRG